MFTQSAAYYDVIYQTMGKDYAAEAGRLHTLIERHKRTPANTLLDVACGTGAHFAYLAPTYTVEGLDADLAMLQVAQQKFPEVPFHQGDMVDFTLDRTFAIVTCLFSSIGYVKTLERLQQAIGNLCRHTAPGGLVVVEPWFAPGSLQAGRISAFYVDQPELKLARMNFTEIEDNVSILNFHYLIATKSGINHTSERHELGLFSHEEYLAAFQAQGMTTIYDEEGLDGRGLYIGQKLPVTDMGDKYTFRPLTAADEPFLWEMLYHAIHVPAGSPLPDRAIVQEPSLAHYVAGWGQHPGDEGLLAIDQQRGQPIGAAWLRLFTEADPGWGFVDAATPEVSMAILPDYRGQGLGTLLLREVIAQASGRYAALSLSVDPQNAALRLYERLGFTVVGASGTSLTMRKELP